MNALDVVAGNHPWSIDQGNALDLLRQMPDACVSMCVTSPPYFRVRDYGTGRWEGGDAACTHKQPRSTSSATSSGVACQDRADVTTWHVCGQCGARRIDEQIGLEDSPSAYVGRIVEVFRQVRRVLHPSGTVWLNLGDSYANDAKGAGDNGCSTLEGRPNLDAPHKPWRGAGLKKKDLIGIPWACAFALRDDGWYLRSAIVWQKISPMPDSCRDRPTRAHEMIFLLTRRPSYFYDLDAERVPSAESTLERDKHSRITSTHASEQYAARHDHETISHPDGRNLWDWWSEHQEEVEDEFLAPMHDAWTIAPDGGKKPKHIALFPREIPRRCISLGSSVKGVCPSCSAPWVRITKQGRAIHNGGSKNIAFLRPGQGNGTFVTSEHHGREHLGWQPTCKCGREPIGALVLDPFAGSGTSGVMARLMGRRFVGFDLSADYAGIARRRIAAACPLDDVAHGASAKRQAEAQRTLFDSQEAQTWQT